VAITARAQRDFVAAPGRVRRIADDREVGKFVDHWIAEMSKVLP
jgi:hypothetical protein